MQHVLFEKPGIPAGGARGSGRAYIDRARVVGLEPYGEASCMLLV